MKDLDLIETRNRQGYSSHNALAADVLKHMQQAGHRDLIQRRSLGAKLSELDRGKETWWHNHKPYAHALAHVLKVSTDSVLTTRKVHGAAHQPFESFPELPALMLGNETPCMIGALVSDEIDPISGEGQPFTVDPGDLPGIASRGSHVWIQIPRGSGKTLWRQWWAARYGVEIDLCHSLKSLAQALAPGTPAFDPSRTSLPMVIECSGDVSEEEAQEVLELLPPAVVLSTKLPASKSLYYWRNVERHLKHDQRPHWSFLRWQSAPDWRRRLSQWINTRLQSTPGVKSNAFDVDEFTQRLDDDDPDKALVSDPRALLFVASIAAGQALIELDFKKPRNWGDSWFKARSAALSEQPHMAQWLHDDGWNTLVAMASANFTSLHHNIKSAHPTALWHQWLPSNQLPIDGLLEIAQNDNDEVLLNRLRQKCLDAMCEVNALRADPLEQLELNPWLGRLAFGQVIRELFLSADPTRWGRCLVDDERVQAVDEALDENSSGELYDIIEEIGPTMLETFGGVAAVETLFLAVGRRLEAGHFSAINDILLPLAQAQMELFQPPFIGDLPPHQTTRALNISSSARLSVKHWIAICWSWSAFVSLKGQVQVPDTAAWLFPGWVHPEADSPPRWVCSRQSHKSMLHAAKILGMDDYKSWPLNTFEFLAPLQWARLIKEERRQPAKVLDRWFWQDFDHIVSWLFHEEGCSHEEIATFNATSLWMIELTDQEKHQPTFAKLMREHQAVGQYLIEYVPAELWQKIVDQQGFQCLYDDAKGELTDLVDVAPIHRNLAVQWLLEQGGVDRRFWGITERLDRRLNNVDWATADDIEVLLQISRHKLAKSTVFSKIWQMAPDKLLKELEGPWWERPRFAYAFFSCPSTHTEHLVKLLEDCPSPPDWAGTWVRVMLQGGGPHSERFFKLSKHIPRADWQYKL